MRSAGRIVAVLTLALLAAAVAGSSGKADPGTAAASNGVPGTKNWIEFTLPKPDGEEVSLARFIGKKSVLLAFWATWCPRCNEAVPEINRMHSVPPTNEKLQILAVDFMESPKKVDAFIKNKKVTYPVLLDRKGKVAKMYGVTGIPTYILLDRSGSVAYRGYELPEISRYLK